MHRQAALDVFEIAGHSDRFLESAPQNMHVVLFHERRRLGCNRLIPFRVGSG